MTLSANPHRPYSKDKFAADRCPHCGTSQKELTLRKKREDETIRAAIEAIQQAKDIIRKLKEGS